jgi:hypothetical protein
MAQNQKCVDEIKMRLEQEEHWFDLKFTSLGVLVMGFFAQAFFREKNEQAGTVGTETDAKYHGVPTAHFCEKVLVSPLTLTVLAVGCGFSMIADMHMRSNRMVIAQNGIWVAEYVEPAFLGGDLDRPKERFADWRALLPPQSISTPPASYPQPKSLVGWEGFLRLSAAYHNDGIYNLTFWPQMFLVTVGIYLCYIYLFNIYTRNHHSRSAPGDRIVKISYIALQLMIVVCAASTHSVPGTFEIMIFQYPFEPKLAMSIYGILGLSIIILSYVFVFSPFSHSRRKLLGSDRRNSALQIPPAA